MKIASTGWKNGLKTDGKVPVWVWFFLAAAASVIQVLSASYNNYKIFKGVFWHTLHQTPLYSAYPAEYFDVNHYGPFFSIIIAPFAIFPDEIMVVIWCMLNAWVLYEAIRRLPVSKALSGLILLITAVEMMTATHSEQINPMIAGWLILAFVCTEKRKDIWATFFIAAGFMVKIYGIAGLLFFLFSRNKKTFVFSFAGWMVLFFMLPMLFSSPSFIFHSYAEWWQAISGKHLENINLEGNVTYMQDISLMGFMRRTFSFPAAAEIWLLLPAAIAFALPLLRFKQYASQQYRMYYLALVLISIVILSSSAESPTYVIAVAGAAIWFVAAPRTKWTIALILFVFILTSLSTTDLFPKYIKYTFVKPYSLKALPCIITWFVIVYQLLTRRFIPSVQNRQS